MQLKAFQKKYLKSVAHDLKPGVMIGKNGLSEETCKQIDDYLKTNELIKIKVSDKDADVKALAESIQIKTKSSILRIVGRTITLYKENPENEKDYIKAGGAYAQKKRLHKKQD